MTKATVTSRTIKDYQGGTLAREGVLCGCGKFEPFGFYAVAQMAQGHSLTLTCECGNKIRIGRGRILGEKKGKGA